MLPSGSALGAVEAYLRHLQERGDVSRAVLRQRSWALREALLFAAVRVRHGPVEGSVLTAQGRAAAAAEVVRVRLGDLFADGFVDDWLALADPVLRGVQAPVPATQRARTASLRALARFADVEAPAHRQGRPVLRELLTRPQLDVALRTLAAPLPGRGPDDHARLAAILGVMSVLPARSAELCGLRRDQVVRRGSDVVLLAGDEGPVLRGAASERMLDWLAVRESLVSALHGGPVHALWTSIRSNSRPGGAGGSMPLPPGMPLRPRGLQRAYARSVEAANTYHQGQDGFPLPRSLDLLRRSVEEA